MADLKAVIDEVNTTDAVKIQFIKEELAADRYQIHSAIIAERLLEFAIREEEVVV